MRHHPEITEQERGFEIERVGRELAEQRRMPPLQDRATELARAGESEKLRAMKPQIETCLKVAREESDRATREFLERHNDVVDAAKTKAQQPK